MGHRKKHAPKHGSLAYLPRKRAKRLLGRIRYWPKIEKSNPQLIGFIGYKAGMLPLFVVEDRKNSPNFGQEVMVPATVLETPPMVVCAVRTYTESTYGLRPLSELWLSNPPKELDEVLTLPKKYSVEEKLIKIKDHLTDITKVRVIAITQPNQACVSTKKPEISEIEISGGTTEQKFDYGKSLLGKIITPTEIFKEGQYVDVISVTTGKGWQGPVKRWGVAIRQHKARKTKRGIATLGPWKPPRVRYSIPRAGQMGFHQRVERNKRILKIGKDGLEVTPKGGFSRYGELRGAFLLLAGSIPGPEKRPIRIRYPTRPQKRHGEEKPQIVLPSGISM